MVEGSPTDIFAKNAPGGGRQPASFDPAKWQRSPLAAFVIAAVSLFAVLLTVGAAEAMGADWRAMLRDRGAMDAPPPLAGAVSFAGMVMLGVPTVLCWAALWRGGRPGLLLAATALLPTLMLLDDLLMLHEDRAERLFYAAYAVSAMGLAGLQLVRAPARAWLLLPALGFLGAAMACDFVEVAKGGREVFGVTAWGLRALAEDGLKFVGYALFAAHLLGAALPAATRPTGPRSPR